MCFCPAEHDSSVRLRGKPVEVRHGAAFRLAERAGVHGRVHRRSHGMLADAETPEDFGLSFRSRAAVAAHRRNDEWLRAETTKLVDDSRQNLDEATDSTA